MNITVTPTEKSLIPKDKPFAVEFRNGLVVLIMKDTQGFVIKQGDSEFKVGTYRDDWYIKGLRSGSLTCEIWHGKIEIEI